MKKTILLILILSLSFIAAAQTKRTKILNIPGEIKIIYNKNVIDFDTTINYNMYIFDDSWVTLNFDSDKEFKKFLTKCDRLFLLNNKNKSFKVNDYKLYLKKSKHCIKVYYKQDSYIYIKKKWLQRTKSSMIKKNL